MSHYDSDAHAAELTRPVFFDRQSLSADDLNCFMNYLRAERRRHNRHVIGWGVNCGLAVDVDDESPWHVRVGKGHAITPSGQEVHVSERSDPFDICDAARSCLGLPGECPDPGDLTGGEREFHSDTATGTSTDFTDWPPNERLPNPIDLEFCRITVMDGAEIPLPAAMVRELPPVRGLATGFVTRINFGSPVSRVRLRLAFGATPPKLQALTGAGDVLDEMILTGPALQPQEVELTADGIRTVMISTEVDEVLLLEVGLPTEEPVQEVRGEVYLAICPDETPTCFKPGVPEHCMPPGDNMHPARIREGYKLEILCNLPEASAIPDCDTLERLVCGQTHVPCPDTFDDDYIVLASISIGDRGIVAIDEFTHRRKLPPLWMTAAKTCCEVTVPPPTTITVPTVITVPTSMTEPTRATTLTLATLLTVPTFLTQATLLTRPTLMPSEFTSATFMTLPSRFSEFTGGPGGITLEPSFFTGGPPVETLIVDPGGPGGLVFDPVRGRTLAVRELNGVGPARETALSGIGVNTLEEFILADSETLARTMRISEVRVADMQEAARTRTMVDR